MNGLFDELISIMDGIIASYSELLVVMEEEKEAMSNWSTKSVLDCSWRKEKVLKEIQLLEEQRILSANKIADTLGIPCDTSVSELSRKLPTALEETLKERRKVLLDLIDRVKYKNTFNSKVALKTSAFLNEFMSTMANSVRPVGNTYSKSGKIASENVCRMLNKSV